MDQLTSSLIQQLKREGRYNKFIIEEFAKICGSLSQAAMFLRDRQKGYDCEIFSPYFVLEDLTDKQLLDIFEKYKDGELSDIKDRCMHWDDFIQEAKFRGIYED